jgi:hypothetical protein
MKNVKLELTKTYLLESSWGVAKDIVTLAWQDDKLDELLLLCKGLAGEDVTASELNKFIWNSEEVYKLLFPDL